MGAVDQRNFEIERTYAVLGVGADAKTAVRSSNEAHAFLLRGIPVATLMTFLNQFELLTIGELMEKALGISLRTLQRWKNAGTQERLSRDQSNRVWKFAEVVGRAVEVFGTLGAAEHWLVSPAIGLDQQKPIDLLATAVGIEAVERHLIQIDYGVYA